MMGLIALSAGPFRPVLGDELGVPPGNRPVETAPRGAMPGMAESGGEGPRRRTALARVYAALCRAADAGEACPSNRDLCAIAGVAREAKVTTLLGGLSGRRLIAIEWTVPTTGARRVVIRASGKRTGWSLHGPRWVADAQAAPRNGLAAMARALRRAGARFEDVTVAEARRAALRTPPDPGMPTAPAPSSYMGCALAGVVRDEPDQHDDGAMGIAP